MWQMVPMQGRLGRQVALTWPCRLVAKVRLPDPRSRPWVLHLCLVWESAKVVLVRNVPEGAVEASSGRLVRPRWEEASLTLEGALVGARLGVGRGRLLSFGGVSVTAATVAGGALEVTCDGWLARTICGPWW